MKIDFPFPGYEGIEPVEIPDSNLMGLYSPQPQRDVDEEAVMAAGMQEPLGAARLRESLRSRDRVLILVDDGTRGTPVARMLPQVLAEIGAAGVPDERIEFLTAQGTHRRMTEDELREKFGPLRDRFRVHQHDWKDDASLHDFGRTADGTPVTANRLLADCDFVLGLGAILPHRVKGMSGGAKIAFPGVSGPEMMDRNQWEASMRMSETVMGEPENSMRLRMEEAGRIAGLRYIVNVVYDVERRIVGCYAGDAVVAHRAGCRKAAEVYSVRMPERADILVVDSHPADRDFWQSAKGLYAGTLAVREGGTMILVAPNPEGVAGNHRNLLEIGYRPHAEIVAMVQAGKVDDLVGVAILADVAQIVDHADCIMVSPGVSAADIRKLGMRPARTPAEALEMATQRQGAHARTAVLRYGGHVLPVVENARRN